MDSVQRGGGGGQPQITFFNVFLVKVKYFSKLLGNMDRPSWWTPIQKHYIFYRNWILNTCDNKLFYFGVQTLEGEGVQKSFDEIHTFVLFF